MKTFGVWLNLSGNDERNFFPEESKVHALSLTGCEQATVVCNTVLFNQTGLPFDVTYAH